MGDLKKGSSGAEIRNLALRPRLQEIVLYNPDFLQLFTTWLGRQLCLLSALDCGKLNTLPSPYSSRLVLASETIVTGLHKNVPRGADSVCLAPL